MSIFPRYFFVACMAPFPTTILGCSRSALPAKSPAAPQVYQRINDKACPHLRDEFPDGSGDLCRRMPLLCHDGCLHDKEPDPGRQIFGVDDRDLRGGIQFLGGKAHNIAGGRHTAGNRKADHLTAGLDIRLQQRLGVTTIYVTHDQTEAMTMADRIVVMKEGVIQQVGTPQEIYAAPVNLFVASFIGTPQMNFIPGKLSETGFENESFRLSLPDALKAKLRSSIGKEVILGLRPEALAVSEGIQENTIPVRLEEVEYMGRYQIVHAMVGGSSLVLSVPSDVQT